MTAVDEALNTGREVVLDEPASRVIPTSSRVVSSARHTDRRRNAWAWASQMIDGTRDKARAEKIAIDIAERLSDPHVVHAMAQRAASQSKLKRAIPWFAPSLAQGDCGLAVMMAAFDAAYPSGGWDHVGKLYLENAARSINEHKAVGASLFSGIAGVALAAHCLSRGGVRYRKLQAALEIPVLRAAAQLTALVRSKKSLSVATFDAISGLSGIGAYLLARAPHSAAAEHALADISDALAVMVLADSQPPRWYTPPEHTGDDFASYPLGNLNLGLAHGIAGVLALLALSTIGHSGTPKTNDAVAAVIAIFERHRIEDQWGIQWPAALPLTDAAGNTGPAPATRCAWCYGVPGIARAVWLGGKAVGSDAAKALAVEAMAGVFRRPVRARIIDSPTFCHGISGLLAIARCFEDDGCAEPFGLQIDLLVTQLLDLFEPQSPLGYRSIEIADNRVDQPGLLDGAAGVALVLLDVARQPSTDWQRAFLIN